MTDRKYELVYQLTIARQHAKHAQIALEQAIEAASADDGKETMDQISLAHVASEGITLRLQDAGAVLARPPEPGPETEDGPETVRFQ